MTRVLQALLLMLACAPAPARVTVAGGTDVRTAPPLDADRRGDRPLSLGPFAPMRYIPVLAPE